MLSRPTPAFDRFAKLTLLATVGSLVVTGGLIAARTRATDSCSVSTQGLEPHARTFVARRTLACQDYEHGRSTKQQYQQAIEAIDLELTREARPTPKPADRVLWATSVLGVSSQYTSESWGAHQALGRPNVYPRSGDIAQAWASLGADDQDEWIELGYDTPQAVSAVAIYETFNPGAVETVELITTSGRRIELRPASDEPATAGANRLVLETPCTSEPIAAVRITVASQGVAGWNEIDAVGLVPCGERAMTRIE